MIRNLSIAFLLLTSVSLAYDGASPSPSQQQGASTTVEITQQPAYESLSKRVEVILVTVAVVLLAVTVHYESLSAMTRLITRLPMRHRPRIVVLILGILLTHVVGVWIFALGYFFLIPGHGFLAGAQEAAMMEYVYYSAVVYSTLGFGDLLPVGPIRFLTGIESVTGLVLITWSASFTFLEMQKFWNKKNLT